MNFGVTCSLELFKDDIVHSRTRVDQRRGDDGQRAAFLNVAGRAEETLRALQSIRIDTTRKDLARRRNDRVVCTSETSDRVEKDNNVPFVLDQSLGLLYHHVGDLNVPRR